MLITIIVSPFADQTSEERAELLAVCKNLMENGILPLAPHLYFPQFIRDDSNGQKKVRHIFNRLIVGRKFLTCDHCDVLVLGTRITPGMRKDIHQFSSYGFEISFKEDGYNESN